MKTISNGDNSITVPNTFFCTKSRYAYAKVALEAPVLNQDVTLEIYDVNNIVNGSHADWVATKTNNYGYATGDSVLYIDPTLIRGERITFRAELKGEDAQSPTLGFEIKVQFTDNTSQFIGRYGYEEIPERGTFEATYTFSATILDKEIASAVLYPVFRSSDENIVVSGKFYLRHEFIAIGSKLPSTWTPSAADQGVSKLAIARKTDSQGVAIFPIGAVCESLIKEFGEGIAVTFRAVYADGSVGGSSRPIVGYADYEIEALNAEGRDNPDASNYPAAKKIVLYPNIGFDQTIFVPTSLNVTLSVPGYGNVAMAKGPFIELDPTQFQSGQTILIQATVTLYSGNKSINIPAAVDLCASGVFLKWIDKSGIPYVYRWTPEITTDEMSVDSTYTQLDEVLQPFEVQNKTLTKRYTLHSRIVERDIYEMCKTIIGSQAVWMYDTNLSDWVRCSMEDSEAEDSGAPMQDLVIEVVKHEYNL